MAAAVRPPAVVPEAPPKDVVSSAKQKAAPNWAVKTTMAATGTLLALLLVIRLIMNLWFFAGRDGVAAVMIAPGPWLWAIRAVTFVLLAVHIGLAVVLALRSRRGRGVVPAKLHGGLPAWLTRLMLPTGIVIAVFAVIYATDQIAHAFTGVTAGGQSSAYDALISSLALPGLAVVYVIGLVALAVHVGHGLDTVATIAAGGAALPSRLKPLVVTVIIVVVGVLVLASVAIVLAAAGGWLR